MMNKHFKRRFARKAEATLRGTALAATFTIGLASSALAQDAQTAGEAEIVDAQFVETTGGAERINMSGKLRMLSQRVTAAACYLHAGTSTDDTRAVLSAAQDEFALITAALEFGNEDLGILGEETRRKTIIGISKLNELWEPVDMAADQIDAGNGSDEIIRQLAADSAPLLDIAKKMVTVISEQYSTPGELLSRDALVIDVAGRQSMLAQRVSKNACLLSTGLGTDATLAELQGASDTFEASLMALRNGMQSAGIQAPPTPEIAAGLDGVIADWQRVQPQVTRVLAGEQLDDEGMEIMFTLSNRLTGGMNAVVGLYSEASKLGT